MKPQNECVYFYKYTDTNKLISKFCYSRMNLRNRDKFQICNMFMLGHNFL